MRIKGIEAELLSRGEVADMVPDINLADDARFPIEGGLMQPRGGTARHDAVARGFARLTRLSIERHVLQAGGTGILTAHVVAGEKVYDPGKSQGHLTADT